MATDDDDVVALLLLLLWLVVQIYHMLAWYFYLILSLMMWEARFLKASHATQRPPVTTNSMLHLQSKAFTASNSFDIQLYEFATSW